MLLYEKDRYVNSVNWPISGGISPIICTNSGKYLVMVGSPVILFGYRKSNILYSTGTHIVQFSNFNSTTSGSVQGHINPTC